MPLTTAFRMTNRSNAPPAVTHDSGLTACAGSEDDSTRDDPAIETDGRLAGPLPRRRPRSARRRFRARSTVAPGQPSRDHWARQLRGSVGGSRGLGATGQRPVAARRRREVQIEFDSVDERVVRPAAPGAVAVNQPFDEPGPLRRRWIGRGALREIERVRVTGASLMHQVIGHESHGRPSRTALSPVAAVQQTSRDSDSIAGSSWCATFSVARSTIEPAGRPGNR